MKRWRHEREFEKRWGDVTVGLMAGMSGLVFVVHVLFVPLRYPLMAATLVMFTVAIESAIALILRNKVILSLDPRERLRKRNGEAPIVVRVAHSASLLESFLEGRITNNSRIVTICRTADAVALYAVVVDKHIAANPETIPHAKRYAILDSTDDVSAEWLRAFRWKLAAHFSSEPQIFLASSFDDLASLLSLEPIPHSYAVEKVSRRLTLITFVAAGVALALFTGYVLVSLSGPA